MIRVLALWSTALLAIVALNGCGPRNGTITGKVMLKGSPVHMGQVTVVSASGATAAGDIQPDGTYRIENAPGGKLKVSVVSPNPDEARKQDAERKASGRFSVPGAPSTPSGDISQWRELPAMYANPDTSGLIVTVSGDTSYDIQIQ